MIILDANNVLVAKKSDKTTPDPKKHDQVCHSRRVLQHSGWKVCGPGRRQWLRPGLLEKLGDLRDLNLSR